ncbi:MULTISPECIES: O-antigen ligase [unclassified Imperialibacter]|uniref:O-antigen ligase family protein n=1 Tax=unclassified Imperialibacter TaxID=2629706 RepID=UPI0012518C37|nr:MULTISPECIES: O-antigen ligase family protein [unclassified Imperialibacter]CAD5268217.1 membrane hypothetical protein [Imperialibacter sp. 89]CAD5296728.1 membrane hypothetical protein [Imperialibacter sp. 75]VVT33880.1 membrane hypothetical protein [Imperialibacter sp. EC-SDR9]
MGGIGLKVSKGDLHRAIIFLVPISEVFRKFYIDGPIHISLPIVIDLFAFLLFLYSLAKGEQIKIYVKLALIVAFVVLSTSIYHSLVNINTAHSSSLTSIFGAYILLVALTYILSADDQGGYLGLLSKSFIISGILLVLMLVIFEAFDFQKEFFDKELKVSARSRLNSEGITSDIRRSSGLSGLGMGAFGSFMEVSIFMVLSLTVKNIKYRNTLLFLKILFSLILVYVTFIFLQSRSFLLAVAAGLIVFYFLDFSTRSDRNRLILLSGFLLISLISLLVAPYVFDWMASMGSEALGKRLDLLHLGYITASRNPFFGSGFDAEVYYYHAASIVHNHYMAYIMSIGLLPSLLYFSLYFYAFINGIKYIAAQRNDNRLIVIGFLAALTAIVVENNLYQGLTTPIVYIVLPVLFTLRNKESSSLVS